MKLITKMGIAAVGTAFAYSTFGEAEVSSEQETVAKTAIAECGFAVYPAKFDVHAGVSPNRTLQDGILYAERQRRFCEGRCRDGSGILSGVIDVCISGLNGRWPVFGSTTVM